MAKTKTPKVVGPNVELLECICEHYVAEPDDIFSIPRVLTVLLRITDEQRTRLFYPEYWPKPFHDKAATTKYGKKYAELVVARIRHFIKTGK
jgi:hypothetical protein